MDHDQHQPDPLNLALSRLLRGGVVVSGAILAVGLLGLLALGGGSLDPARYQRFAGAEPPHLARLDWATLTLHLGIVVLMLVPVARLAFAAVLFARRRDRLYTAISLVVLAVVVASALLARVE